MTPAACRDRRRWRGCRRRRSPSRSTVRRLSAADAATAVPDDAAVTIIDAEGECRLCGRQ